MLEWINQNLFVTIAGDEIIFPIDSIVNILAPVSVFVDLFGTAIDNALMNNLDVKNQIRLTDIDNVLGYNELL